MHPYCPSLFIYKCSQEPWTFSLTRPPPPAALNAQRPLSTGHLPFLARNLADSLPDRYRERFERALCSVVVVEPLQAVDVQGDARGLGTAEVANLLAL